MPNKYLEIITSNQFDKEINAYLKSNDLVTFEHIWELVMDIIVNGELNGIGHPHSINSLIPGHFSRHINLTDRLVYKIKNNKLYLVSCKGHYETRIFTFD
jgi:toxin YoeB